MGDLNIPSVKFPQQLHVMIAGHTQPASVQNHVADDPDDVQNSWATVDKIADKDCLAT